MDVAQAAIVAFGVVFIAELGDKTQLLALGFGARHSLRQVALGLTLGYGAASLIAVVVGGLLGATFPRRPIEIVGGLVFILFGVLALRPEGDDDDVDIGRTIATSSVIASIALTILIAEMGDKTQVATATLAARSNPVGTWIGATFGEATSGMVGAIAGSMVGDRIPTGVLRWSSATLFAFFGVLMLIGFT